MSSGPTFTVGSYEIPFTELDSLTEDELLEFRGAVYDEFQRTSPDGHMYHTTDGYALLGSLLAALNTELDRRKRQSQTN